MTQDDQDLHAHDGFAGMHSHEGGAMHWHDEFGEHMAEGLSEEEFAIKQLDWRMHNVQIVTVGVDIGSSTSHLMFSKIYLQLVGEAPNVRSVVVAREILWQSPIMLTPYLDDGTIDAKALGQLVYGAYDDVGATANEIDSGSIILTGEALKRTNARAVGELFAKDAGKLVTASAGHHMEAVLAANGSGTVSRSRRDQRTLLNIDIGGGTTKFALVRDGVVLATAAVAIGARLIVKGRRTPGLTRLDGPAQLTADRLGINLALGEPISEADEARIVQAWTDIIAGLIAGRPPEGLGAELMLTEPLPAEPAPQAITFSGGVSEFIFMRENHDYMDLGKPLAKAIRAALGNGAITLPAIIEPNLGIRATAVGASMYNVQAGINAYVSEESVLPLMNLPVLVPKIDIEGDLDSEAVASAIGAALTRADLVEGEQPLALYFEWLEDNLDTSRVGALARGIAGALPRTVADGVPLVLLLDQLAAHALGAELKQTLALPGPVVSLEGIYVSEFDFIDVAPVVHPSETVPVSIKSLLFAGGLDRRSIKQALRDAALAQR